jgi:hypothetical protein
MIYYTSTDKTLELFNREAPEHWKIQPSRHAQFLADEVDREVREVERTYPGAWQIALNTPELLVHPALRHWLYSTERQATDHPESAKCNGAADSVCWAYRFPSFMAVGDDKEPFRRFESIIKQRHQVALAEPTSQSKQPDGAFLNGDTTYSRFMHASDGEYTIGRHGWTGPAQWAELGYIMKMQWTPWPEIKERKLHVKDLIPKAHFDKGWGYQHNIGADQLEGQHTAVLNTISADLAAANEAVQTHAFKQAAKVTREHISNQDQ